MNILAFDPESPKLIQQRVMDLINGQADFLSSLTSDSPRAAGDAIQTIIKDNFESILGGTCSEYISEFSRRSMADLSFKDHLGNNYVVDVKTHREDTVFNMPNVISVSRLAAFYQKENNFFLILMVKYKMDGLRLVVSDVKFFPIERLSWNCLAIGALGSGQIQICNSNKIEFNTSSRDTWKENFYDTVLSFYPKEINKIKKRMLKFEKLKKGLTKTETTSIVEIP